MTEITGFSKQRKSRLAWQQSLSRDQ